MLNFPSNSHYSEESKVIQKHRGVEGENYIEIIHTKNTHNKRPMSPKKRNFNLLRYLLKSAATSTDAQKSPSK